MYNSFHHFGQSFLVPTMYNICHSEFFQGIENFYRTISGMKCTNFTVKELLLNKMYRYATYAKMLNKCCINTVISGRLILLDAKN